MVDPFPFKIPPVEGDTAREDMLRRIEEAGINVRALHAVREDTWIAVHEILHGEVGQALMEELLIDRIESHPEFSAAYVDCPICNHYRRTMQEDRTPTHIVGMLGLESYGEVTFNRRHSFVSTQYSLWSTDDARPCFALAPNSDSEAVANLIVESFVHQIITTHKRRVHA